MKRQLTLWLCCWLVLAGLHAQKDTPKWAAKARRAVFSLITYDQNDRMLHTGNGFFVSEDGVALSDYALFEGAFRAVAVTTDGKEWPIKHVLGADEMYDAIKFRVDIGKKAPGFLTPASQKPVQGETVYLLAYSSQKERDCTAAQVKEATSIAGGFQYYSLNLPLNPKAVSCPVLNAEGTVVGLLQNSPEQNGESYVLDVAFAENLQISLMSPNQKALDAIGIKKALPPTEDQALVYLLMGATQLDASHYLDRINDFIDQYPTSSEGYMRRAMHYVYNDPDEAHLALAEADYEKALKLAKQKGDIHYNWAKLIVANQESEHPVTYKDWGYAKALDEAGKALAVERLPLYQQLRGDIYFAMQDYEKALACYDEVNQSKMVSPQSIYATAKCRQRLQAEPDAVIALIDSAAYLYGKPYPKEVAPYLLESARLKEEQERFREAVASYDAYSECVDGQVNDLFYYYREQANYKAKDFRRALDDIESALAQKPDNPTYLAEYGAVLLRVAHYEEAIGQLRRALEIDPNFAACHRLIGYCLLQQGNAAQACEAFAQAKALGDEAVDGLIRKNCSQ